MNLALSIALASSIVLIWADDLDGFVPGFRIDQIFIPNDCTHRAREGDYLYQDFIGTFENGTQFDSSYDRGKTFNFHLGVGEVIRGMDMGMKGMCKGEKRKVTIPPELGYGDHETGGIPAWSTLIFEVVLTDIEPSSFKIELIHMPEGCQRRTAAGDYIREHYNGTFINGTSFDSSYNRNETYDFTLGEGRVIKGVDLGLMNMCEGEIRRLTIPAILAYGDQGYGDIIPAGATVVFDALLVDIVHGKLRWYKVDGPSCGSKDKVQHQDTVTVTYNGFTESGFKFNNENEEYTFTVGDTKVLHGLSEGVDGMCIGERRRLRIPPELAVGDVNGAGVPENIRLTLDVELTDIHKVDLFKDIDSNADRYLSQVEVEEWIKQNPEFAESNADKQKELMTYYYTERDADRNGWVSRNEFYSLFSNHDEL